MPVVPATQDAEAEESLEPVRQKLERAEIVPLHSSLDDRVRLRLKTKTKQKNRRHKPRPWVYMMDTDLFSFFFIKTLFTYNKIHQF